MANAGDETTPPPSAETAGDNPAVAATTPVPPKTSQITAEAVAALINLFDDQNFGVNKRMPGSNVMRELDDIIKRFDIKRSQAAYQLRMWFALFLLDAAEYPTA